MNNLWTRRGNLRLALRLIVIMLGMAPAMARADAQPEADAAVAADRPIVFEDVTEAVGLAELVAGWEYGHAAAWGDVSGNGWPDLYIGAFAAYPRYAEPDAPIPNMLFLNQAGRFTLSPDEGVRLNGDRATTSMTLLADLNNDGKSDLLVGTHNTAGLGPGSQLFANAWPQPFRNVTADADAWPHDLHMRNAAPIDLDHDGLLDLILVDGRYQGDQQSVVALRNKGDFKFEDVSRAYGFPVGHTRGLGTAIGDVNHDGRLDVFVADANRMFITRDDGTFVEYRPGFFHIPGLNPDDWPCGAAFADLTGDGLLDLVVTVHGNRMPAHLGHIFVYVNRGLDEHGMPDFQDVTDAAGLRGFRIPRHGRDLRDAKELKVEGDRPVTIPLRAAQLALIDVDHNGRRDILMGMIHLDDEGRVQPVVLQNQGVVDGVPRFAHPPVDSILGYYATAPIADYDRDGRIDIFVANWHDTLRSHLFRNVSKAGGYLVVRVKGEADDLNRMGIGATVRLYHAGHADDPEHLIARGDITMGNGYSVGDEPQAHFGLGDIKACDVVVTWQGRSVVVRDVKPNQYLDVAVGDKR
jgi:hypothetical protein